MDKVTRYTRPQQLLTHILEQPALLQAVQNLEPEVLTKLVRHVGLEDSGELVALFTTEQLMEVFDEDLWASHKPGEDEEFDDQRFALWLEVLLESGAGLAARKVADMDEDLLTLALSRQVFVINIDELASRMSDAERSDEDDLLDKELDSCLYQEFEEFQVISRNHRTWEAIRAVLVELDSEHHDLLTRLLERCCHVSHEYIEDNGGLYEVLSSDEMVEADVAAAREERREKKGYVPPSSATSFLTHARIESLDKLMNSDEVDPITRAHFRTAAEGVTVSTPASADQVAHASALRKLLQDAAVLETSKPLALLGAGPSTEQAETQPEQHVAGQPGELLVTTAMRLLRDEGDAAYGRRLHEMGYLSNVLLAGCEYRFREMRPLEAAQAALATCNLGAERLLRADGSARGSDEAVVLAKRLETTSLVKLFRIGWHVLYTEVVAPSAQCLLRELERKSKNVVVSPAGRAAIALENELKAGKPWRATSRLRQATGAIPGRDLQILISLIQQLPLAWLECESEKQTGMIETYEQLRAVHKYLSELSGSEKKKQTKTKRARSERRQLEG